MSETKFQVGDLCAAFGLDCVVESISNNGDVYCVRVKFPGYIYLSFTIEGLLYLWHQEPSLKLIKRPKKKVTKTMYQAIHSSCYSDGCDIIISQILYDSEKHARETYTKSFIALGPAVTFEVEE